MTVSIHSADLFPCPPVLYGVNEWYIVMLMTLKHGQGFVVGVVHRLLPLSRLELMMCACRQQLPWMSGASRHCSHTSIFHLPQPSLVEVSTEKVTSRLYKFPC